MAISPRITQRLMVERSLTSMQAGLGRLAVTQEQLSTGRIINRPSDSPTGTNSAMRLREQVAHQSQFARNAQDGIARLGRTDSVLMSALDSVRRVRDLTLQGASTGSNGPQAREALAIVVEQIRETLIGLANTTHLGRPLFGGTTGANAAYSKDGSTYSGTQVNPDGTSVQRRVGENETVRVDVTGPEAFGNTNQPGGPDDSVFALLNDVAANLRSGDTAKLSNDIARIDVALNRLTTTVADVGTRYARLESTVKAAADAELDLQASLSEIENVDMARAMVDLQMNEVAYQAALGATARVLQPSLLDFLR